MPRAVHPPFVRRPARRRISPVRLVALALALSASGCLDDGPATPQDDWLRLSISAQVGSERGRTVAIDVFYRRDGDGDEEELVALSARPDRVTVEPGTVQVPVTVDIVACMQDARRVRTGPRQDTCPLVVILRLLGEAGEEIDNERIEPEAPAPGETVTLPTVTLREAALVLTPSALTFSAVQDAAVPAAQVVEVTNGGGGSLGDLSVTIDEAGAEWLHAVVAEDGTRVTVQPLTTSLEPGSHTAAVSVHATGAPNSPQVIEVTYQVAPRPTHLLTVSGAGNGSGRVRSEPEGIDCTIAAGVASGACSASFDEGKLVFLIAEPQSGSGHTGWSGECEGEGGCGVIVLGPREVTATFALVPRVLTATATGTGSGRITSDPEGLDCTVSEGSTGGGCSVAFDHGTEVTLTFVPDEGSSFGGWSGACEGSGPCIVTMTEPREVSLLVHRLAAVRILPGAASGSGVVRSSPAGIDCAVSPESREGTCVALFPHGTQVTLTATPDAPDTFGGWEGACDTGEPTCTLTIGGAVDVGARFVRPPNALTVTPSGDGSGRIVSFPAGIDCTWANGAATGTCSAQFPYGTEVTLSAEAGEGSDFAGWSNACAEQGDCVVTLDAPRAAGARFVLRRYTIAVGGSGNGSGRVTSTPAGIDCRIEAAEESGQCTMQVAHGTEVRLEAEADAFHRFGGWSGACTGGEPCVFRATSHAQLTATFLRDSFVLQLGGAGSGAGTVSSSPEGGACTIEAGVASGACAPAFPAGTNVTLTAEPGANSVFVGWSGACSGGGPCVVPMTEARTVTATFALVPVRLDVTGAGAGSGMVTSEPAGIRCTISAGVQTGECGASFPYGTQVRLLQSPEQGSTFGGWSGACTGSECVVHLTAAQRVTATFGLATHTVAVQMLGNASGRVTSEPSGIDCAFDGEGTSGTCEAEFLAGASVRLRAHTDPESLDDFKEWNGACTGTGDCVVEVTRDLVVSARFEYAIPVRFDLGGTGSGRITSVPAAIDCRVTAGQGTGTCEATFPLGTELTLIATPDAGSVGGFDIEGGFLDRMTVTLLEPVPHSFTATFQLQRHQLTVMPQGLGSGEIRSEPAGIACWHNVAGVPAADCVEAYDHGTMVTLTATPQSGSTFIGWGGTCSGVEPCTVSMIEARNVSAQFDIAKYTLTIKGGGNGNGQVSGYVNDESVIDCTIHLGVASGTCVAELPAGTVVPLQVDYYYYENTFVGWSGACTGTDQCTVTMTENREVTATFDLEAVVSVEVFGPVNGHVRSSPGDIDCTIDTEGGRGTCENTFAGGTVVTLTAHPPENAIFAGWGGDCEEFEEPTCTLVVDGRKQVFAEFESTFRTLGVNLNGAGSVTSTPAGIACVVDASGQYSGTCYEGFPVGSEVVLTATPDPTTTFEGWGEACAAFGMQPTCTLTMSEDLEARALFAPKQWLTLTAGGTGTGTVRSSPDGIACTVTEGTASGTCSAAFPQGSQVTLTAEPAPGSTHRWGAACLVVGNASSCTLTMTQALHATISFDKVPLTLTLTTSGSGEGRVVSQPGLSPAIDCVRKGGVTTGACAGSWPQGTSVQLTASTAALSGNEFANWSGLCSGTAPTCVLPGTASGAVTVNAAFRFDECEVAVPHALFSQTSGDLDDGDDCRLDVGIYRDRYAISSSTQQLYEVGLSSTGMPSELRVRLGSAGYYFSRSAVGGAHLVLAPPGTALADIVNTTPDDLGIYTLTTRVGSYDGCTATSSFGFKRPLRTTFGVSATFALTTSDCGYVAGGRTSASPSDLLTIYVPADRTLRVAVQSSQFDPMIEVRAQKGTTDDDWTGTILGTSAPGHGTATLELSRPGGGYLHIWVTSRTIGGTGSYTIQIFD